MRLVTDRPPNLETPLKYFREDFTPNEVFFVRWHLFQYAHSGQPGYVSPANQRERESLLELSLDELKNDFEQVSVNALCVCAGNARSCLQPRVAGAQWVNGGMGNARWTGVRLKDVLAKAKADAKSVAVAFNGMDDPPLETVPDFVKSLPLPARTMAKSSSPMRNERRAPCPAQRLSAQAGRSRMVCDVLGRYAQRHPRVCRYVSRVLDGQSLPCSQRREQRQRIARLARERPRTDQPHRHSLHLRFSGTGQRPDQGTRYEMEGLAFDGGSGIARRDQHRRREKLDRNQARSFAGQLFLAPLALPHTGGGRQVAHAGEGDRSDR